MYYFLITKQNKMYVLIFIHVTRPQPRRIPYAEIGYG